jgi:hypothetical protein
VLRIQVNECQHNVKEVVKVPMLISGHVVNQACHYLPLVDRPVKPSKELAVGYTRVEERAQVVLVPEGEG